VTGLLLRDASFRASKNSFAAYCRLRQCVIQTVKWVEFVFFRDAPFRVLRDPDGEAVGFRALP